MYKLRIYNIINKEMVYDKIVKFNTEKEVKDYIFSDRDCGEDEITCSRDINDFFEGKEKFSPEISFWNGMQRYKEIILEREITDFECYLSIYRSTYSNGFNSERKIVKINNKEEYINVVNNEIEEFNKIIKGKRKFKVDDETSAHIKILSPYYDVVFVNEMLMMTYLSKSMYADIMI